MPAAEDYLRRILADVTLDHIQSILDANDETVSNEEGEPREMAVDCTLDAAYDAGEF